VDAARKRGGIHIVWLAWFTDSIALWRRLDEARYLMGDPAHEPDTSKKEQAEDEDDDDDDDDWDSGVSNGPSPGAGGGGTNNLELGDIDWNDINDEVDAAMAESDDDDEDGMDDNKDTRSEEGMSDSGSVIR
jgi:RNA polymerase II subunit A C-terminal domain phosphatase